MANFVDSSNTDGNGHGTHVAGTIGGTKYGVAKRTTLLGVKVLNASGSGTNSGVISGMNFVVTDARTRSCPNGVVVNMSLGGSTSTAVNNAARAITSAGHFLAVAAGNSNANAASFSPASEPSACTVGATTSTDAKASYSNYGALVDVFAPGSGILSAWIGGTTASVSFACGICLIAKRKRRSKKKSKKSKTIKSNIPSLPPCSAPSTVPPWPAPTLPVSAPTSWPSVDPRPPPLSAPTSPPTPTAVSSPACPAAPSTPLPTTALKRSGPVVGREGSPPGQSQGPMGPGSNWLESSVYLCHLPGQHFKAGI